jgi:hypothetical protein
MLAVAGIVFATVLALFVYLGHERLGLEGLGLATLRTVGLSALILLVLNPGWARSGQRGARVVLLDASLSMGSHRSQWQAAVDTSAVLAGPDGTVLAFGGAVRDFAQREPSDGVSRLDPALRVARGLGRPITVVSDGELTDSELITAGRAGGVELVLVPRDTAASAALLDVAVPPLINRGDSMTVIMTIGVFGRLMSDTALLEVTAGERQLLARRVLLPQPPARVRRSVTLSSRALRSGPNVLEFHLTAADDTEARDNVRWRTVTTTDQPAIVVIADPADWEGRFLSETFSRVSGAPVRGFASIADTTWVDMRSLESVSEPRVARAARDAGVVVIRGTATLVQRLETRGPWWWWPSSHDNDLPIVSGDWYIDREVSSSPLAPALARIAWDSLPPLIGVARAVPESDDWVALTARLGRRGAARPVLVGGLRGSRRQLVTTATGFWRWALRGDRGAEAIRTVTAAGLDWLLQADGARPREVTLASGGVAMRGTPLIFEWTTAAPDSAVVVIDGDGDRQRHVLYPSPAGRAEVWLEPGVYGWSIEGSRSGGVAVVEPYSVEFTPGPVTTQFAAGSVAGFADVRLLRQHWWMFLLALMAFAGEWAWRQRRGLP